MFEKMGGYTELLFPNNILKADSVLGRMVTDIPEEDWTDQVQIIGLAVPVLQLRTQGRNLRLA